jgi:hypothetical protein
MKKAIKDLCFLIGVWFTVRVAPTVAARILDDWSYSLRKWDEVAPKKSKKNPK